MFRRPRNRRAFTLIELLSIIAIVAVLVTAAGFFTASYVTWSRSVADQQTLTVLNDALTRYKNEGGNVSALTFGAPIGHVLDRLSQPITWAGMTHQVLNTGKTYIGRSLDVLGNGATYRFARYGTNTAEVGGVNPAWSPAEISGVCFQLEPFRQLSGATVLDYSGNGRNAAFPGGGNNPTWSATGLVFNGASTQYLVPASPGLTTGSFSFFFVKVGTGTLWGSYGSGGFDGIVFRCSSTQPSDTILLYSSPFNQVTLSGSTTASTAAMTEAVAFKGGSGGTAYSYRNGAQIQFVSHSKTQTTAAYYSRNIGRNDHVGGNFSGTMYAMLGFNRQLSAAEVLQLHNYYKGKLASLGVALP